MKTKLLQHQNSGFTMIEMVSGVAVLALVGMLGYSMLLNSTNLLAKGVSLNSSNAVLRNALDRLSSDINQAYGMPKLVNVDLSPASLSGPAAGVLFDRYIGGPYIVTNIAEGAGLARTDTSFLLKSSVDPLTAPATPVPNDVVLVGAVRLIVKKCTSQDSNGVRTFTITLPSEIGGSGISWDSKTKQPAYLLHRKAFVVATAGGRGELRLYNDADTSDPSDYVVLTRGLSGRPEESTPFSILNPKKDPFLKIGMRVEDQQFSNYLSAKQNNQFNTFLQVDTSLQPRNRVR